MLIGEVARRSGVSARMLRHYDALGLVRPTDRTPGGYREYSSDDIRRLFHVEGLRSLGLSLRDVARALDDPAFTPMDLVQRLIAQARQRITDDEALLGRLGHIEAAGPDAWGEVLETVALLQELASDDAMVRQRAALVSAGTAAAPANVLVGAALKETDPNVAGALRLAVARSEGDVTTALVAGLAASDGRVRLRAVVLLADRPDADATAALHQALDDGDVDVARAAALALGARGEAAAAATLVEMVVAGANDIDAGDALSGLATRSELADRIAADLVAHIDADGTGAPALRRIAQALAEIPGDVASDALAVLAASEEPSVALPAAYVIEQRAHRTRET